MRARHQRLYVNIDHVATLRQARGGTEPDPVEAAAVCESAGADGITAHLREDRRHIQDADVEALATRAGTVFNLEAACTDEIIAIALRLAPHQVTLVPEKRTEVTTEGGLDVRADITRITSATRQLRKAGIRVSVFIDPDDDAVRATKESGADAVELHTGSYANGPGERRFIDDIARASTLAAELGMSVHAGHGLTVSNVGAVAAIPEIEELNIGHSIVSRAVLVGLPTAVREIRAAMDAARASRESGA